MVDDPPDIRSLRREWLVARIFATLGALLLLAVAALLVIAWLAADAGPPAMPSNPAATAPPDNAAARRQEDIALCEAGLVAAQALGIVPGFAVRDGDEARAGDVQGRYICRARTSAARYTIVFDVACPHLGDARCFVPYTISQDGGGVLYRRP